MIENLFLSVGAMKAGTTWLFEQLKDHPKIHSTPEKEIHYFEQVNGNSNPISYSKRRERMIQVIADKNASYVANHIDKIQWYLNYGGDEIINDAWYEKLFGEGAKDKMAYCADYSNLYALLQGSGWKRVRQNCKNLKVVYTLRDPLSRIWSHYKFHMQFIGKGDQIIESGTDHFTNMMDKDWFWSHACYDQCIDRLEKHLGKDELKIFFFEDFRNKPQGSMDDLCGFLGIDSIPLSPASNKAVNASVEVNMPAEWKEIVQKKLEPTLSALSNKGSIHDNWNVK